MHGEVEGLHVESLWGTRKSLSHKVVPVPMLSLPFLVNMCTPPLPMFRTWV